ncbi:SGNH/GDSL hydrolase family protein [Acholeplasma manati]|uniref:SGNH/GDSL hydrolase family protein n=1 Tax=Paracholeplasma manati TaxID=591373 RepID=A0ABT2YBS5_9MOLU|nr:SGNH/GDSL hydrolase family protein [Paracholeplasma manati]MCV2232608.1 SGNH/GDSL hydrolase family protein [Paracholeplasma manati]
MRLLFQGDSITDCNRNRENPFDLGHGYVKKIQAALPNHEVLNRGISGNRTIDLLMRWQKDTLDLKPDVLSIFVGINEVWHYHYDQKVLTPMMYEDYYKNLIKQVKYLLPNTKILLIEPFVFPIGVYQKSWDVELIEEQAIVRKLAQLYDTAFLPLQEILNQKLNEHTMADIADDGVHPTDLGHEIIKDAILDTIKPWIGA